MSSNKKIHNRLNKLFDDIKQPEHAEGEVPAASSKPAKKPEPSRKPAEKRPATGSNKPRRAVDEPKTAVVVAERAFTGSDGRFTLPFQSGEAWNMLEIDAEEQTSLQDDDQALVKQVVDQLSLALQNAQLFQQTQQQAAELAILNDYGRELSAALNQIDIAHAVAKYTDLLMEASSFFLALYHKENHEITFPLFLADGIEKAVPVRKLGNAFTDWVIRNKQPLLIEDELPRHRQELGLDFVPIGNDKPALCWLGAPLILGDEVLGVIVVQSVHQARLYNSRHRDLLVSMASQASIAIQTTRLFEETQKRASQLETLNEIGRLVSQQIELKSVLNSAYEQLKKILMIDAYIVMMLDPITNKISYPMLIDEGTFFEQEDTVFNPDSNVGKAITTGEPSLLQYTADEYKEVLKEGGSMGNNSKPSASALYVPLKSGQRVMGVLSIQSYSVNAYGAEQLSLVENVANQLATAIQNARLFEETRIRAEELAVLNDLSRSLSSLLEESEIIRVVYEGMRRLIGAKNFYLAMYDRKHNEVVFTEQVSSSKIDSAISRLPLGQGITSHIIQTAKPVMILNGTDNWLVEQGLTPSGEPAESFLGIPLMRGSEVIGAMAVQDYTDQHAYTENHLQLFTALGSQTAIALENARLFKQTQGRARREQMLREITARVRNTADPSMIIKTAAREIGQALGLKAFVKLADPNELKEPNKNTNGSAPAAAKGEQ